MSSNRPLSIASSLQRGDRVCLKDCDSIKFFNEKPFIWETPMERRHAVVLDPYYTFKSDIYVCLLLEHALNLRPNAAEMDYFETNRDITNTQNLYLIPRRLLAEEVVTIKLFASRSRNGSVSGGGSRLRRNSGSSVAGEWEYQESPRGRYPDEDTFSVNGGYSSTSKSFYSTAPNTARTSSPTPSMRSTRSSYSMQPQQPYHHSNQPLHSNGSFYYSAAPTTTTTTTTTSYYGVAPAPERAIVPPLALNRVVARQPVPEERLPVRQPTLEEIDQIIAVLEVSPGVANYLMRRCNCSIEEAILYYLSKEDKSEFLPYEPLPPAPAVAVKLSQAPVAAVQRAAPVPSPPKPEEAFHPAPQLVKQFHRIMRVDDNKHSDSASVAAAAAPPSRALHHTVSENNTSLDSAAGAASQRPMHSTGSFVLPPKPSITEQAVRSLGPPLMVRTTSAESTKPTVSQAILAEPLPSPPVRATYANSRFSVGHSAWKAGDRVVLRECTDPELARAQAFLWNLPVADRRGVIATISMGRCDDCPALSSALVVSFDKPINAAPSTMEESFVKMLKDKAAAASETLELRSLDVRYVKVIPLIELQAVVLAKDTEFNNSDFKNHEVVVCSFPGCADRVVERGSTMLMCFSSSHFVCKKHVFPEGGGSPGDRAAFQQIQRDLRSIGQKNDPYTAARAALARFIRLHFPHLCEDAEPRALLTNLCESNEFKCPLCLHYGAPLMAPFCSFQEFCGEGGAELAAMATISPLSGGVGGTSQFTLTRAPSMTAAAVAGGVGSGKQDLSTEGLVVSMPVEEFTSPAKVGFASSSAATPSSRSGKRSSRGSSGKRDSARLSARRAGPRPVSHFYTSSLKEHKGAQELVDVLHVSLLGARALMQQCGSVEDAIGHFVTLGAGEQKLYTDAAYSEDEEGSDGDSTYSSEIEPEEQGNA